MEGNENGDNFNGVSIKLGDGTKIGKLKNIKHVDQTHTLQRVFEFNYNSGTENHLYRKKKEAGKILDTSLERRFFEKIFEVALGIVSDQDSAEQNKESIYEKVRIPEGLDNPAFGKSLVHSLLKDLMYLDVLNKVNARYFIDKNSHLLSEEERRTFMKYFT